MLRSPHQDANGYCSTFTIHDIASLKAMGANRDEATIAAAWIDDAELFMAAYSRVEEKVSNKLLSTMEQRMVFHVHKKSAETRASFSSLRDIAGAFYLELKSKDERVPTWNKLGEYTAAAGPTDKQKKTCNLRETGDIVTDKILEEKGFHVGGQVQDNDGNLYLLHALNPDAKTATLKLVEEVNSKAKKKLAPKKVVDRTELLKATDWHPCSEVKTVYLNSNKIKDPLSLDFKASIVMGAYKNAVAAEWHKYSCDDDCNISVSPQIKVYAKKTFKTGVFKLIGLTNHISVLPADKDYLSGGIRVGAGQGWHAFARTSNDSLVQKTLVDSDKVCVPYWTAFSSHDVSICNCQYSEKTIEITVLGEKVEMIVPMIVNTAQLKVGDEIIVRKTGEASDSSAKRGSSSQPKPAGKKKQKTL